MPSTFLRWFTRGPLGSKLVGTAARANGDTLALFDHVDGQELRVGEFRASGSMSFRDPPEIEFADTLPAWAASVQTQPSRPSLSR